MCVPFRFVVVVVSFSWFFVTWVKNLHYCHEATEKIDDRISKGDLPLRKNVDVEKKISCQNIRAIDSRFDSRQKFDRKWAATEVDCFDAFSASLLELDKHNMLGGVVVPIIDVGQTKDYVDRNAGGQVEWLHEVTQLGWYLRWKFAYLSGRTKKVISRKLKYVFTKKTTPQLLQHVGLQNIKEGVKTNFGRLTTIISNLFNGCWRPLLKYSIPVLLDRGFII